jgi:hypothetical protein
VQLSVPLIALLGLLAWAGLTKIVRPATGTEAVAALLPRRTSTKAAQHVLRAVGAAELTAAAAGFATTTRIAGLIIAAAYAALTAAAHRIRTVAPDASCGCVGGDAPITRTHLVINALAVAVGGAAAALRGASTTGVLDPHHAHGLAVGTLALVLAGLIAAAMNVAGLTHTAQPTIKQFGAVVA